MDSAHLKLVHTSDAASPVGAIYSKQNKKKGVSLR